jgi:hypothetical protein
MNCFCIGNVVDLVYEVVDHDWWVGSPSIVNRRSWRLAELTEVELRRCSSVQKLAARQWRGRRGRGVSTITTLAAGASGFGGATKVDGDGYSRS